MSRSGYQEFVRIVRRFKSLSAMTLTAGGGVPFVAYLAGLAPPWPPGVLALTALAELISLILVYHFLNHKSRHLIDQVLKFGTAGLTLVSLFYWGCFALFTFSLPLNGGRELKGIVCKPLIT